MTSIGRSTSGAPRDAYPKRESPGQRFTSKVGDFHPQIRGWFCPQTDKIRAARLVPLVPLLQRRGLQLLFATISTTFPPLLRQYVLPVTLTDRPTSPTPKAAPFAPHLSRRHPALRTQSTPIQGAKFLTKAL